MLDIGQFAKPCLTSGEGQFRFGGADREEIARQLRIFADAVSAGDVAIVKIQGAQVVSPEDFYTQALLVEFIERETAPADRERKAPERIIDLPSV